VSTVDNPMASIAVDAQENSSHGDQNQQSIGHGCDTIFAYIYCIYNLWSYIQLGDSQVNIIIYAHTLFRSMNVARAPQFLLKINAKMPVMIVFRTYLV